jgi:hypothetical protein
LTGWTKFSIGKDCRLKPSLVPVYAMVEINPRFLFRTSSRLPAVSRLLVDEITFFLEKVFIGANGI